MTDSSWIRICAKITRSTSLSTKKGYKANGTQQLPITKARPRYSRDPGCVSRKIIKEKYVKIGMNNEHIKKYIKKENGDN